MNILDLSLRRWPPGARSSGKDAAVTAFKKIAQDFAQARLIISVGMFFTLPMLWMVLTSFKGDRDVFHIPLPFLALRQYHGDGGGPKAAALRCHPG